MSIIKSNETLSDKVFDVVNVVIMSVLLLIVAYPLYFVVIASISDPFDIATGKVFLFPASVNLAGYKEIFKSNDILTGYRNSIFYTVVGTMINLALTMTSAYSLSRKDMPGRNLFMMIFAFTMFFGGGLIPTYLVVEKLGLLDKYSILLLIAAVNVYNVIIARTFLQSNIPNELREAASIDGCDDFRFFFKVVIPLSKAVIAVLTIFYAVGHWNSYFNALIYLNSRDKFPLQLFLREILVRNEAMSEMNIYQDQEGSKAYIMLSMSMRYALIILASVPVLILYPFMQKHFMKGVMVGAIKG